MTYGIKLYLVEIITTYSVFTYIICTQSFLESYRVNYDFRKSGENRIVHFISYNNPINSSKSGKTMNQRKVKIEITFFNFSAVYFLLEKGEAKRRIKKFISKNNFF